jgi:hypothetical protein
MQPREHSPDELHQHLFSSVKLLRLRNAVQIKIAQFLLNQRVKACRDISTTRILQMAGEVESAIFSQLHPMEVGKVYDDTATLKKKLHDFAVMRKKELLDHSCDHSINCEHKCDAGETKSEETINASDAITKPVSNDEHDICSVKADFAVPQNEDSSTGHRDNCESSDDVTTIQSDYASDLKLKQDRLVVLRHASRCNCEGMTPHCAHMKQVWKHLQSCKVSNCNFKYCMSSKYILMHFSKCENVECEICRPVRAIAAFEYLQYGAPNINSASWQKFMDYVLRNNLDMEWLQMSEAFEKSCDHFKDQQNIPDEHNISYMPEKKHDASTIPQESSVLKDEKAKLVEVQQLNIYMI